MSHQPQRIEKDCLNCGATVAGRYCQACGQENIVTRQSVGGLIKHFIYDVFHFDGKFFDTLKRLLFRPGRVPREYISGKRGSYLDPIRMYLFTSALFFLVFFTVTNGGEEMVKITNDRRSVSKMERLDYATDLHQRIAAGDTDSTLVPQLNYMLDTSYRLMLFSSFRPEDDTVYRVKFRDGDYYLSVHKITPINDPMKFGGGWINRRLEKNWREYKQRFNDDDRALVKAMTESFFHKFPYILFISLPFFALVLKLLYFRRKQFFYSDHAVFTLYQYIFNFILLLAFILLTEINKRLNSTLIQFLAIILLFGGAAYLLIAMKSFYGQRWGKTVLKFLLLNILAFLITMVLMTAFILFSVFQL